MVTCIVRMPRRKGGNKKTAKVVVRANVQQRPKAKSKPRRQSQLDSQGAAYARLLRDPCNAALANPTFEAAEGGYLNRFTSYHSYNAGGTDTQGYIHYTPNAISTVNADLLVYSGNGTVAAPTAQGSSLGGRSFLTGNCSAVRVIAACITVLYMGNEQGRQGRIHFGQTNGSLIDVGETPVPDNITNSLEQFTRTPSDAIDVIWKPDHFDETFTDPNASLSATNKDKMSSLTIAWAGLPAGTQIMFKITAVYQWQPKISTGISFSTSTHTKSKNTLADVINSIENLSANPWVRRAGQAAMNMAMGQMTRRVNMLTM